MIGQVVGNYRIVDRLGDGGMGSVYRAVDRMLDREVAIKVLRPELARQTSLVERFRQEAIALARLSHPNIATLHGLEQHGDQLLMIMEYVRGDTLEAIVQRSGRVAWGRACELCVAVLHALDHAHDKGVVHRDIKPANIMLSSSGVVKVMDFGIARLMGRSRQTQFGHAVGTPMYMAPEQLRGHEVDGRTDLYAVAAVLFELVTGRMAFEADSDYSLMMKQLNDSPPAPSSIVPDIPTALDEIVVKAMSKSPVDRFPNALALAEQLQALTRVLSNPSRRPVVPPTRLAPDTPPARPATPPASPIMASATAETAEQPQHAMLETRLAADIAPEIAPDFAAGIAATRLASEPRRVATPEPGVTRLADATPATSEYVAVSTAAPWMRDWRAFAAVGAFFVVAAVGVRAYRNSTPTPTGGDSVGVVSRLPGTGDSTEDVALANIAPAAPREDASTLIIERQSPSPPAEEDAPAKREGVGDAGTSTPPASGSGSRKQTPPTRTAPVKEAGTDRAGSGTSTDERTTVPVESRAAEPSETAAAAREGIRTALREALSDLGDRSGATAQSLLQGGVTSQWISLAKEGRVSASLSGSPDIDLDGTRASATFDASVNVRSPFGANRRRPARFAAELQRSGSGWRVTSLRPIGSLSLD